MPENKGFLLFSLPYLALKHVILSLDIFSRLNVSLCSKKSQKIAGAYKMPEVQVGMILRKNSKNIINVILVNENIELEITHTLNVIPIDNKEEFGKVIQTSEFKWEFHHDPSVNLTAIICNRLLKFYGLSSLGGVDFRKDVEQSDFDKFPILLPNARAIIVEKNQVKKKDLDQLFSNHRDIKSLALRVPYPKGYDNYRTWRAKVLLLIGAPPRIESLLDMDYEQVVCRSCFYKTSDINRFLKHWLQLTNENNKYLKREVRLFGIEIDSNVFEDLPVVPWNPKQRGQFFHFHNHISNTAIDCSKGFDLLRDDGVLATILVCGVSFCFNIWNERFPDIPKKDFAPHVVFY